MATYEHFFSNDRVLIKELLDKIESFKEIGRNLTETVQLYPKK